MDPVPKATACMGVAERNSSGIAFLADHDCISHPSKADRAQIVGLGEYLRRKGGAVMINGDEIVDPWGKRFGG